MADSRLRPVICQSSGNCSRCWASSRPRKSDSGRNRPPVQAQIVDAVVVDEQGVEHAVRFARHAEKVIGVVMVFGAAAEPRRLR